MMFRSITIRTSVSMLTLIGVCSFAPVQVQAQGAASHHFTPVNGWNVGTTDLASVRGLKGVKLPCVLSAEYDNGYVVRFSGGGNQMLALAIDFRQNVFNRGQKYAAIMSIGDSYVKQVSASAFTPGILLFNLRDLTEIYGVLKAAKEFSLEIEGNSFTFSLQQIGQNFASLEACYTTGQAAKIQPVSTPMESSIDAANPPVVIVPPVQQHALPQSFDDILTAEPDAPSVTQNTASGMRRSDAVLPRSGSVSRAAPIAPQTAAWTAKSGEDIRAVLSRWAGKAGYDLQWQASDSGKVAQDISVDRNFEDAVSQLLAENRAVTGITGRFDSGSTPQSPSSSAWSATTGADMKSVIDQWAGRAGVAVVWKTSAGMPPLRAPVQADGFESALQSLLDQYSNDLRRPVAQLNTDPQTKKRTLMLDVEGSS